MLFCAFELPGCGTTSLVFILTYCFPTSPTVNGFPPSLKWNPPGVTIDRGSTRIHLTTRISLSTRIHLTTRISLQANHPRSARHRLVLVFWGSRLIRLIRLS
jgi:hypothetical protein